MIMKKIKSDLLFEISKTLLRDTIGANDDQGLELFNSETKTYSKYNEQKRMWN